MKIAILGAGQVGGALAKAFAKRGHEVLVSSSDPQSEKMKALLAALGAGARSAANEEAVAAAEIVVLATPWNKTKRIIKDLEDALDGKILIDATNPVADDFSGLERGFDDSAGESVARWAKGARVVKAMNQIGFELMDGPTVKGAKPLMFVCGDDGDAKKAVGDLVASLGFDVDDCGGIEMARYLEPLAWLWINRAIKQGKGRNFAFVIAAAKPSA